MREEVERQLKLIKKLETLALAQVRSLLNTGGSRRRGRAPEASQYAKATDGPYLRFRTD